MCKRSASFSLYYFNLFRKGETSFLRSFKWKQNFLKINIFCYSEKRCFFYDQPEIMSRCKAFALLKFDLKQNFFSSQKIIPVHWQWKDSVTTTPTSPPRPFTRAKTRSSGTPWPSSLPSRSPPPSSKMDPPISSSNLLLLFTHWKDSTVIQGALLMLSAA